jgi:ArsR family transcriptional regulator
MTAQVDSHHAQSELLSALASPVRLAIIDLLSGEGELSVSSIAGKLGLTTANTSEHLMVLRRQGIVSARKAGTNVLCRIANPAITEALALLNRNNPVGPSTEGVSQ